MNRLIPNAFCWVCDLNMRALWQVATTVRERQSLDRQMSNGICDQCQRRRHGAAVEYERASTEVVMLHSFGAWNGNRGALHPVLRQALYRIERADARCVELKMWTAERAPRRPYRHYREEP